MEALLDEHMPAPHRRRPVVALWWLWLLLAGIGGGLWQRYRVAQVPPATPLPPLERTAEMPVAAVAPPASGRGAVPHPSEHPTASLPQPVWGIQPGRGCHDRLSAPALAGCTTVPFEATPSPSLDGEAAAHRTTELASSDVSEIAGAAAALHAEPLALLPVLLDPTFELPARRLSLSSAQASQMATSPTPRTKHLSVGLTLGTFAQPSAEMFGLAIVPTFDWHASRRWGLRAGMGYRFTYLHGKDLSASNAVYLESSDLERLSPGSLPSKADGIWVRLSHTHRLEAPVLVYSQTTPRLRLYGGGMGGVLLAARVQGVQPASGNEQHFHVAEIHQLSNLASARLFRWEGSALAGAGYALSRRFEVSVQAQWRFFTSPSGQPPATGVVSAPLPNSPSGKAGEQLLLQISLLGKVY